MIDIHSHLLFGVDDGAPVIDESMRMLCEAEELGIKVIFATPHVRKYLTDNDKIYENYCTLAHRAADYDVTLLLGYEVLINPTLAKVLHGGRNLTLGGTRYLLLELPFHAIPLYTEEILYRLQLQHIIPIIAHPERNLGFIKYFETLKRLVDAGCRTQLDAASILGVHGTQAKNFAHQMIKLNLVDYIASDAHSARDYTNWHLKAYQKVTKWAGEKYANRVFCENPAMIIDEIRKTNAAQAAAQEILV